MLNNLTDLMEEEVIAIAMKAGESSLSYFGKAELLEVKQKPDHTPQTIADLLAHQIIAAGLKRLTPEIPILSEEGEIPAFDIRSVWPIYWLTDPLDGTRGFIDNIPEFSVNIALIVQHQPLFGVIYNPVDGVCYYAQKNKGAYKRNKNHNSAGSIRIHTKTLNERNARMLTGRYHNLKRFTPIIEELNNAQIININSSIKFGLLSEGLGDVYLRYGPTQEWDTAAGQCILEEAGGLLVDLQGQKFQYNLKQSLQNPAFLAVGDPTALERILKIIS